ncbi:MAG: CPBP family intramembrane metalloprotease [Maricaulis sp.]|jgi:membrane protease YdiL (CAAX protease family)|nr:CPBP family intramembrane metalloprotease [Maricaulis sp.]
MHNKQTSESSGTIIPIAILSLASFLLWSIFARDFTPDFITNAGELTRYLFVKGIFVVAFIVLLARTGTLAAAGFNRPIRPHSILWGAPFIGLGFMIFGPALQTGLEMSAANMMGWIVAVILIGISEEGLFRGIVYRALAGTNLWLKAAITSVAFGSVHLLGLWTDLDPAIVLAQSAFAASVGLVLFNVRLSAGSVWTAIFLHALFDATAIIPSGGIGEMLADPAVLVPQMLVMTAVFLLWGGVSLFFLSRKQNLTPALAV